MTVYFARDPDSGHVKIGYAANVRARISGMNTGRPSPLEIIRTMAGGFNEEQWLHEQFADRRIRGEWFRFDERMLAIELPFRPIRFVVVEGINRALLRRPLRDEPMTRWCSPTLLAEAAEYEAQVKKTKRLLPRERLTLLTNDTEMTSIVSKL